MKNTKIEWANHSFNPWIGCSKISDGCHFCYALARDMRFHNGEHWGAQGTRVRTSTANWRKPIKWNIEAEKAGVKAKVFCASLADVFEEKHDQPEMVSWRANLLAMIQNTANLNWLLLTKRPENVMRLINEAWQSIGGNPVETLPDNIWIGTSVENQEQADKRIPELLKIPATVRFLSMEPLLGEVILKSKDDFSDRGHGRGWLNSDGRSSIDWVIVGGESGSDARPMHPGWARSIRDQCNDAGIPFLFKQWGEWAPVDQKIGTWQDFIQFNGKIGQCMQRADGTWAQEMRQPQPEIINRVGKKKAGRLLDGAQHDGMPE